MIEIAVDEKACVSCGLCVDACPTQVFRFNTDRDLPEVAKPSECFGCLSCSEICPADALDHQGAARSQCFYHDPYALDLAQKLSTSPPQFNVIRDAAGRQGAMRDLAVRLLSVSAVLKDIMGGGLAPVGLMAGRALATQLPRYQPPRTLEEALGLARQEFSPAWDLNFKQEGEGLKIEIGTCFVRELCAGEKMKLGGELCVLFTNYLSGYLGKMAKKQMRITATNRSDERCTYEGKVSG